MKQWEWIGVTLIREHRLKKTNQLRLRHTILERVTFSQPYGEMVSVIEDSETVRDQFQRLLLGKEVPSDGVILGYSDKAVGLSIASLSLTEETGKAYSQAYFQSLSLQKESVKEQVLACQRFSELGDRFFVSIHEYSVLEKAQLVLSLSLHTQAEVICVDESIALVSSSFFIKVMTVLTELKDKGSSIWLFTDQLSKVGAYCDRVLWLQFGRLRDYGGSEEVKARYEAYLTTLHAMSLEAQQRYWDQGIASQTQRFDESKMEDRNEPLHHGDIEELPLADNTPEETRRNRRLDANSNSTSKARPLLIMAMSLIGIVGIWGMGSKWLGLGQSSRGRTSQSLNVTETASSSRLPSTLIPIRSESTVVSTEATSLSTEPIAMFTHQVVTGDTLSDLAIRYSVTVAEVMAVNELMNERLVVGDVLSLPENAVAPLPESVIEPVSSEPETEPSVVPTRPSADYYSVVEGDTLYQIARRHGKSVLEFQQANGLQTPNLSQGQQLVIPD